VYVYVICAMVYTHPPDWSGAVIFLVIALLSIFFYWSMRKRYVLRFSQISQRPLIFGRIPLAKLLLQVTIDITKHHPSVYLVVLIGLVVQAALSVWYTFTCIAIYVKWTPGSPCELVYDHRH
jgi:hypothetical protein